MEHGQGLTPGPDAVPQELLDEMLWVFRVEDASPWNYSMFVLVAVVLLTGGFLLRRSILANRNRKTQAPEKPTRGALSSVELEARGDQEDNHLNVLTETLLLAEKLPLAQEDLGLREKGGSSMSLPEPQESES
ncbi:organic solute transporter subunit beta [Erinaceus europaeus]|uniref:Organic solute transporter subunit beta n=1 Tax=Erinaceus europaeus TaxID=9365 RepID=A0A1S3ABI2_ERIEU|nr:organic solute transporter subunit beta [Erinaceus europaeus]